MALVSHSDECLSSLGNAIDRALEICGGKAETYAKQRCPVDTSNLRNSITHARQGENMVVIGTNVKYAPFVELGHHQQPGRYVPKLGKRLKASFVPGKPFLRPAAEDHGDEYRAVIENELRKG